MDMGEDDVVLWQDVLDDVAAGKKTGLQCPFCEADGKRAEIVVSQREQVTRLECRLCRKFIEGRMAVSG